MLHIHVLNCDLAAFIRSIVPSTKSGQTKQFKTFTCMRIHEAPNCSYNLPTTNMMACLTQ